MQTHVLPPAVLITLLSILPFSPTSAPADDAVRAQAASLDQISTQGCTTGCTDAGCNSVWAVCPQYGANGGGSGYSRCLRGFPACGLCSYCSTKAYPDHGWALPVRHPFHTTRVQYRYYLPRHWYGDPAARYSTSFPMVYQPTDTTQLGFSYHHVPTWMPNRSLTPPYPHPSSYHDRSCPNRRCSSSTCRYNQPYYEGSMFYSNPACAPGTRSPTTAPAQPAGPTAAPVPPPAPPATPVAGIAVPRPSPPFMTQDSVPGVVRVRSGFAGQPAAQPISYQR